MSDAYTVLLGPIVSEKAVDLGREGKYCFKVPITANKIEIRRAVETIFPNIHVAKVNTVIVRGKLQRRVSGGKRVQGYSPNWKKAVVTLRAGDTLPIYENL